MMSSRDDVPWPLDQHVENVERTRADRNRTEITALILPGQAAPVETNPRTRSPRDW
jgi:hypothetical protein